MEFNRNENKPVIALLGAGAMGTAIVRRIAANKTILLGDISEQNLERAASEFRYSGYEVHTQKVDAVANSGIAYIASKRANHLRVRTAAATTWGDRGARINTISPGIIVTPLAYDEFKAAGEGYQKMIDASPMKRVGTIDEIAAAGEFLLSDKASFVTGTDLLIDGGVIAAMNSGRYQLG